MVGRAAEQALLARAWTRVKAGERQVLLVSGEPGIGKTRLVTETARAAHADGGTVLLGSCDEDVGLPYRPFVEALRHYVVHAPQDVLAAHVRAHKGELVRLVPELAERVPDLPKPQVAEAETERYLLFEAATGLLSAGSEQQPIVLVLEDLHWAGTPELLLLKHVVRSSMPRHLLVLATYRESELTRTHPLTAVLADLHRETNVERIALHGLDDAAVVALVTATAGHDLAQNGVALAHALHAETEGSPFFIGEILRHLAESGAIFQEGGQWTFKGDVAGLGIPEGVKQVIGRRLTRLSEPTNKVLSLASVIGRQFDLALLTRLGELSEDATLDALDEAIAAGLVAEVPRNPDHFSFSHALIRATLYEELSAARRARLHRRVGEALEELTGTDPSARIDELAHHWLAATQVSDQAKAVRYARQAGERALAGLAFEEAAAHYERALAVLEPRDRDGERLRCDLLLALGDAQRRAGNAEYRETVAKAVEVARALGDGERLALATIGHARPGGYFANANTVDQGLIALYEEANRGVADADTIVRARIMAQLAVELIYHPQRDRRLELVHEALAVARKAGDRHGLAAVLNSALFAINDPMTLQQRRVLSAELSELAREVGGLELQHFAANHGVGVLLESGDIGGAERALQLFQRTARELRQPFYEWQAQLARAMWAIMRGEPDAEQEAFAALEIGTAGGQPDAAMLSGVQLYMIRADQGRLVELTDAVRTNVAAMPHISPWRASLTLLYCETDRLAEAREEMATLSAGGFSFPLNWAWVAGMRGLADACEQTGDAAAAAILYEQLRPVADQVYTLCNVLLCCGSFHYPCAVLAACLRRWAEAEHHCEAAMAMNERLGARPWVVRTRRAWASMLLDRNAPGDAARARDLIAAGRAEAEQLGMARELVRFERLRERMGSAATGGNAMRGVRPR
jgi:hypothetical protein